MSIEHFYQYNTTQINIGTYIIPVTEISLNMTVF